MVKGAGGCQRLWAAQEQGSLRSGFWSDEKSTAVGSRRLWGVVRDGSRGAGVRLSGAGPTDGHVKVIAVSLVAEEAWHVVVVGPG